MNIDEKLIHIELSNREANISHLSYDSEILFFKSIQQGNAKEAYRLFQPFTAEALGTLSEDKLRNLKYHLIITVAFITRYCIEGGMEMETAYNLSDIYIRNIDVCQTEEGIHKLHREVVEDYLRRMQAIHKTTLYSKAVATCLDYIYTNLQTKLSLEELADMAGLTPPYLSRLFHQEVGMTISEYISRKRMDATKNLLKYSEYSLTDIANYLNFSSESHFIRVFKKFTGYTPKRYRDEFFRTHWN